MKKASESTDEKKSCTFVHQYYYPSEAAAAQICTDLAEYLAGEEFEVTVLASRSTYETEHELARRETVRGVRVFRLPSTNFGRSSSAGRVADYVSFHALAGARLLFGSRQDVVIALTAPPLIQIVCALACAVRGTPLIIWNMDLFPDLAFRFGKLKAASPLGKLLLFASRYTLRRAHAVIALGDAMAGLLAREGVRRLHVIHNWAEQRLEESSAPACRTSSGDELVVMYSGNMGFAHEFETLVEAFERIETHSWFSASLLFVGGGHRRKEVQEEVRNGGLSSIRFAPYVAREELAASLAGADVHVVTLLDEMVGILVPSKVYGILAAGKPILYIGPAAGEIHDIVTQGACGYSIRIGDVASVIDALRAYAGDAELRRAHGTAARRFYDQNFRRGKAFERFAAIISHAASSESEQEMRPLPFREGN